MKKRNNPKIEAMKQRSLIIESERKNLHTPKFYITEQEEEIKRPAGDPYEYKKDENGYYFKKRDEENWKKTNNSAVKAVFGSNVKKSATKSSGESKSSVKVPFKNTEEGNAFRQWVNNTHPVYAKEIDLDKEGSYNNSYIAKAWNKYGSEYQNKDKNKDKNKEKKSENDKHNAETIANKLKDSYGGVLGNDKEAWAQSAFEAIADKATYEKVKSELGQDPYKFVKSFMSTNKDYHNNGKTIDGEYKRIMSDDEGKNTKTPEITKHNYDFGFNTLAVSDSLPKNISFNPKEDGIATKCTEKSMCSVCVKYIKKKHRIVLGYHTKEIKLKYQRLTLLTLVSSQRWKNYSMRLIETQRKQLH